MTADSVRLELPPRPEMLADWEDLLVRLELMPRALQHALEDACGGEPTRAILEPLVEREQEVSNWLLGLAGGAAEQPALASDPDDPRELRERFAGLRARTFSMVQRRGLEVWDWEGETERHGRLTVYQALLLLLRDDVQALSDLRSRSGAVQSPC